MPIARLDSRALVSVAGPEARPFLHNLLTQDVETLASGQVRFGALLAPQGRLLFDLFLFGTDDGVLLDVRGDARDALVARLSMYRLRARVEIAGDPRPVLAAWGEDAPADWPRDPRLPDLGRRAVSQAATGTVAEADWRTWQHARGAPDAADLKADADYPIEANFDLLNGIEFRKGCFIGQETTSRMHRRGKARNRLVPIAYDGAPPAFGAEVLSGELRAGEVRSGLEGRGMALLRLDRLADLGVDGRPVRAEPPAWISLD